MYLLLNATVSGKFYVLGRYFSGIVVLTIDSSHKCKYTHTWHTPSYAFLPPSLSHEQIHMYIDTHTHTYACFHTHTHTHVFTHTYTHPPTQKHGKISNTIVLLPVVATAHMGHDGMFNGKRYFYCTNGHGILVRYKDVAPLRPANKRPPVKGNPMFPSWPEICKRRKQREAM